MADSRSKLLLAVLGHGKTLDEVLNEASDKIAAIGERNTMTVRRTVRNGGMTSTRLYDLPRQTSGRQAVGKS